MIRIAFLVNNEGHGDSRVVKTAEVMAAEGFECTVFGCSRAGSSPQLIIRNGVRYEVLPLKGSSALSALCALIPLAYARWTKISHQYHPSRRERGIRSTGDFQDGELSPAQHAGITEPTFAARTAADFRSLGSRKQEADPTESDGLIPPQLPFLKLCARHAILMKRRLARTCQRILRIFSGHLGPKLQPRNSTLGVRALFGHYLRTFLPALREQEFDVIYSHELWTLETAVLCREGAAPLIVYDSHELELHRNNDWLPEANRIRTDYEKKYIHRADLVVTVCGSISKYLHDTYGISYPLVVPNAPLAESLITLEPDRRLKRSLGLTTEKLLVYTGKVTTGRGLNLVVTALAELDSAHLAIVGPRVAKMTEDLAEYSATHGISERIHLVDPVPPEYLVSLISDADLAVVPIENVCLSYYYSLPNKIYEAAMAGLPVLASDFPELGRFVREHRVGKTVDFTNPTAVRSAISGMLTGQGSYNNALKGESLREQLTFDRALRKVSEALTQRCRPQ